MLSGLAKLSLLQLTITVSMYSRASGSALRMGDSDWITLSHVYTSNFKSPQLHINDSTAPPEIDTIQTSDKCPLSVGVRIVVRLHIPKRDAPTTASVASPHNSVLITGSLS